MSDDPDNLPLNCYEIQVVGRLNPEWGEWFEGMHISVRQTSLEGTATILWGWFADQAALFGMLTRIRDLGIRLISVNRIEIERP